MDQKKIDNKYISTITKQCLEFLKIEEFQALRRFISPQVPFEEDTRVKVKQNKIFGFDNPETNELVDLGQEEALKQIVQRVLKEHGINLINLCPKCGGLARTPLTKQCRHCAHNWR